MTATIVMAEGLPETNGENLLLHALRAQVAWLTLALATLRLPRLPRKSCRPTGAAPLALEGSWPQNAWISWMSVTSHSVLDSNPSCWRVRSRLGRDQPHPVRRLPAHTGQV